MSGWWYRASTEQKLRQVEAGIELGLTARQVALASGVRMGTSAVYSFAAQHGLAFRDAAEQRLQMRPARRQNLARMPYTRRKLAAAYFGGATDLSDEGVISFGDEAV